ncbi:hypothetical protein V1477_021210 [Vespula maculifrons]|uniref:Uncharacterized protein n=1 Tax=Vespula maculifrons TaxID=7453 RepID=A0ABD2AGH4_VESMC
MHVSLKFSVEMARQSRSKNRPITKIYEGERKKCFHDSLSPSLMRLRRGIRRTYKATVNGKVSKYAQVS